MRLAPGFAESQEGRAVLLLPTFSSLRSKRVVSRCRTCPAGRQHSARRTVPLLTPTLPRGSGLSDSGSVCAESASSHSVPENESNIVNFTWFESSRIYSFSDFSWIPLHACVRPLPGHWQRTLVLERFLLQELSAKHKMQNGRHRTLNPCFGVG